MTQNNLGIALVEIGKRSQSAALIRQAQAAFEQSRKVFSDAYGDRYETYFSDALAEADQLIAEFMQ